jgi:ABC-2 type transport system permease protein
MEARAEPTTRRAVSTPRARRSWVVVTIQELRDLWLHGRGLPLALAFSVLLSVVTYLAASNQSLNFLEVHEAVNLALQVAVAVGAIITLLTAADAISGERERGTLESLLLTPAPRRDLVLGKLLAALSVWVVLLLITVPYLWFLGRNVGAVGDALGTGATVGTLVALSLAALGIIISAVAATNRLSLSISLFVLLALFAPTQFPTGAQSGWFGDLLLRVNPVSAALHWMGKVVVDGHSWSQDADWLISPVAAGILLTAIALLAAPRWMRLRGGLPG